MISEDKIKIMTKVAIYEESSQGQRDLEISQFEQNQYINVEMISSFMLNTVAFFLVIGLFLLLMLDKVLVFVERHGYHRYAFLLLIIYLLFIILQMAYTQVHAKKRYDEAIPRLQEYRKNLNKLYYMYEVREKPEEMKQDILKEKIEEELDAETIDF
jgi:Ca2+/Na+ antiporter